MIFENNHGTAPGLAIEDEEKGKVIIPPRKYIPMFEESVEPYLRKLSQHIFYSKNINITRIGESAVERALEGVKDKKCHAELKAEVWNYYNWNARGVWPHGTDASRI